VQPDHGRESNHFDQAEPDFTRLRPRLFGIAYRMLGSAVEAEDIVQDVWLRWQGTDRSLVRDAAAFLATTTTRIAINVLQSAHSRRETYIGPWLPEPVDTTTDPELGAVRAEALKLAILLLLEKLTPTERATYVLREAFDYSYREIADIIEMEEANVRQHVSRARKHVEAGRSKRVNPAEQRRLLDSFVAAARNGDMAALENLFASDIVSYSDGGGVVRAAGTPLFGRNRVAKFITAVASHFWVDTDLGWKEINGQVGLIVSRKGVVITILTIDASPEGIDQIMWLMNPHKLKAVGT
jgi:RNA polymerase sigma-70 factor (TIGR02957 family)